MPAFSGKMSEIVAFAMPPGNRHAAASGSWDRYPTAKSDRPRIKRGRCCAGSNGDAAAHDSLLNHACDRLLRLTRKMFHGYPNLRRWEQADDVFQNSMVRLHRAMAEVPVESVRHFFNLAAVQVRRELLDLAKHHFGPEGGGANHHTDGQPADDEGGTLHQNAEEPDDLRKLRKSKTADWNGTHLQRYRSKQRSR